MLFGAGVVSADIAAGLAARIGAGIACETTEIALADGGVVATRPALGDTVMVESGFRGTGIVLARANAFAPDEAPSRHRAHRAGVRRGQAVVAGRAARRP